jgi:hypothetical protein
MKCNSLQLKLGYHEFRIGIVSQLEAQLPTETKHSDILTKHEGVNATNPLGTGCIK